jgi:tRNA-specific 2-thiouridylase
MARVFVGLSGGVDSAVSAGLLKAQGHEVTGVFIKIWQPEFIECTWRTERLDAMRVCVHLGIPFREIDLSEQYKKEVADEMIAGYARGVTPNPDVLCNKSVKFGMFLKWALEQGAEKVAMGHYAQVEERESAWILRRGIDTEKDQSYFLYQLGQHELSRALFPVGGLRKTEVRTLAQKMNIPVAQKADSQGLCFVGDVDMRTFLKRFIATERGAVLDTQGKVIGEHDGAVLYTTGERQGFRVQSPGPWYVVSHDIQANTITVSKEKTQAMRTECVIDTPHWIGELMTLPLTCEVQVRYRGERVGVTIKGENGGCIAVLERPQTVAQGQSLVFYDGDKCLGGAIVR